MTGEQPQPIDARLMPEADYQAAKKEILRRFEQDKFRRRDAADLAKITARHEPKKGT